MRLAIAILMVLAAAPLAAKEKARFLGTGTYATAEGCEKLKKIAAGGPKNVETTPELLDEHGFHGWEGDCEFTKIFEHEKDKSWLGLTTCVDGATISSVTYVFIKDETSGVFEVAAQGEGAESEQHVYSRCETKKGN